MTKVPHLSRPPRGPRSVAFSKNSCGEIGVRKNNRATNTNFPYIMARL
jgi:hypothetical protein